MHSRILRSFLPRLLLAGTFCAVPALHAGNVQGRARKAAAVALAVAASHWLFAPDAGGPLPDLEDPSLHQGELGLLQERHGRALRTSSFAAAVGWTRAAVWPPVDPQEDLDWSCPPRPSPLSTWQLGTAENEAAFRAHLDRQKARFAELAEASARNVAERDQALDATRRGYVQAPPGQSFDRALQKQELALRVAERLERLYQPIHGLLQDLGPADLVSLDAIRSLDQRLVQVLQGVGPRLERENIHNQVLIKMLEIELERAGRKLERLKVRSRLCVTASLGAQIRTQESALRSLGGDLADARGRMEELDAATAAIRALLDWPWAGTPAGPDAGPPRPFPEEEARQ